MVTPVTFHLEQEVKKKSRMAALDLHCGLETGGHAWGGDSFDSEMQEWEDQLQEMQKKIEEVRETFIKETWRGFRSTLLVMVSAATSGCDWLKKSRPQISLGYIKYLPFRLHLCLWQMFTSLLNPKGTGGRPKHTRTRRNTQINKHTLLLF